MVNSILMEYIDELIEIGKRLDYILGQYEPEDKDVVKPMRKVENQLITEIAKLQSQFENN